MVDPVVHLELNPGRRQDVQRAGGNEGLTMQELACDDDGARRIEEIGRVDGRHVSSEGGAYRSHLWIGKVVAGAVGGARTSLSRRYLGWDRPSRGRSLAHFSIDQVPAAQHVTEGVKIQQAHTQRQLVPCDELVDDPEEAANDGPENL